MSAKMRNSKMNELTHKAVRKTIEEFDELGKDEFLRKYNFGRAIKWFIRHKGRFYDAKAIAGVAHKYLEPGGSYLDDKEFHTGKGCKAFEKLEDLGFALIDQEAHPFMDLAPGGCQIGRIPAAGH